MFSLFRKKEKKQQNSPENQVLMKNPTDVFRMLGPAIYSIWNCFIEGEHAAVEIFDEIQNKLRQLDIEFQDIDFDRQSYAVESNSSKFCLTAEECMYLQLLELDDDVYLSHNDIHQNVILLTNQQYRNILKSLTQRETEYCRRLKKIIENFLLSRIEKISEERYGYNICEHILPFNTLDYANYHKYISEESYHSKGNAFAKWNRISYSPIFSYRTSENNPLIPIGIRNIEDFLMDYICYVTMALPTLDWDKVTRYRDERTGKTVMETIIQTFGIGIDEYLEKVITDMNCAQIRRFIRNGLRIK